MALRAGSRRGRRYIPAVQATFQPFATSFERIACESACGAPARDEEGRPAEALRSGPLGPGMVQLWVDTGDGPGLVDVVALDAVPQGWCTVLRARDRYGGPALLVHADTEGLRRLAVLDVLINNADRKGGHVLAGLDGAVYGVDHGICLHREDKLRTVLWGFLGQPSPPLCPDAVVEYSP